MRPARTSLPRGTSLRLASLLVLLSATSCVDVYDHGRNGVLLYCDEATEGFACDDRNACTVRDTCVQTQCVGAPRMTGCDLAASRGGTPSGSWSYGVWSSEVGDAQVYTPADFVEMENCGGFYKPEGLCDLPRDDERHEWTSVQGALMHPDATPRFRSPIQRWTSESAGPVRVAVEYGINGSWEGHDGTVATIYLDGVEVWRFHGHFKDELTDEFEMDIEVGSQVDMVVHAVGSDAEDTTTFVVEITGIEAQ